MAKKNVQLGVVFRGGTGTAKAVTVLLEGWDLYTMIHHPELPIASKHSYHESGETHTKTDILDKHLKSEGRKSEPLGNLKGFKFIDGGGGPPPALGEYKIKIDSARRRSLVLTQPTGVWGAEVWAIETGRDDLLKRIQETPPYAGVQVHSLVSDWSSPQVLVKVWISGEEPPYDVIRYEPPVAGRVPFIIDPPHYKDTWLEPHFPPRLDFEKRIIEDFRRE